MGADAAPTVGNLQAFACAGCGCYHVRLSAPDRGPWECSMTGPQLSEAADCWAAAADRVDAGGSFYLATRVDAGCLVAYRRPGDDLVFLAVGSSPLAGVVVSTVPTVVRDLAAQLAALCDAADAEEGRLDDLFGHRGLRATVAASAEDMSDQIFLVGCPCGSVHAYASAGGKVASEATYSPAEAEELAEQLRAARADAERLSANAPKLN